MEPTCWVLLWATLNKHHTHTEADHRGERASGCPPFGTSPWATIIISSRCPALGQVLAGLKVASALLNTGHWMDTQMSTAQRPWVRMYEIYYMLNNEISVGSEMR